MKSSYLIVSLFAIGSGLYAQAGCMPTSPVKAEQLAMQRKELVARIDELAMKFHWQELQKIATQESAKKMLSKGDVAAIIAKIKEQKAWKHGVAKVVGGMPLAYLGVGVCAFEVNEAHAYSQGGNIDGASGVTAREYEEAWEYAYEKTSEQYPEFIKSSCAYRESMDLGNYDNRKSILSDYPDAPQTQEELRSYLKNPATAFSFLSGTNKFLYVNRNRFITAAFHLSILGANYAYWRWALKDVFAKRNTLKVLADLEKRLPA